MEFLKKWLAANKLALAFFLILALAGTSFLRNRRDATENIQQLYDLAIEMVVEIDKETQRVEFDTALLETDEQSFLTSADSVDALLAIEENYLQRLDQFPGENASQAGIEYLNARVSHHRNLSLWLRLEGYNFTTDIESDPVQLNEDLERDIERYSQTFSSENEQNQITRLLELEPSQWETVTWVRPSPKIKTRRLLTAKHTVHLESIRAEITNLEKQLEE